MTVKSCKIKLGLELEHDGYIWRVDDLRYPYDTDIFIEVLPDFPENATLYQDQAATQRIGIATRGPRIE